MCDVWSLAPAPSEEEELHRSQRQSESAVFITQSILFNTFNKTACWVKHPRQLDSELNSYTIDLDWRNKYMWRSKKSCSYITINTMIRYSNVSQSKCLCLCVSDPIWEWTVSRFPDLYHEVVVETCVAESWAWEKQIKTGASQIHSMRGENIDWGSVHPLSNIWVIMCVQNFCWGLWHKLINIYELINGYFFVKLYE